jgi:hypothetical protein
LRSPYYHYYCSPSERSARIGRCSSTSRARIHPSRTASAHTRLSAALRRSPPLFGLGDLAGRRRPCIGTVLLIVGARRTPDQRDRHSRRRPDRALSRLGDPRPLTEDGNTDAGSHRPLQPAEPSGSTAGLTPGSPRPSTEKRRNSGGTRQHQQPYSAGGGQGCRVSSAPPIPTRMSHKRNLQWDRCCSPGSPGPMHPARPVRTRFPQGSPLRCCEPTHHAGGSQLSGSGDRTRASWVPLRRPRPLFGDERDGLPLHVVQANVIRRRWRTSVWVRPSSSGWPRASLTGALPR